MAGCSRPGRGGGRARLCSLRGGGGKAGPMPLAALREAGRGAWGRRGPALWLLLLWWSTTAALAAPGDPATPEELLRARVADVMAIAGAPPAVFRHGDPGSAAPRAGRRVSWRGRVAATYPGGFVLQAGEVRVPAYIAGPLPLGAGEEVRVEGTLVQRRGLFWGIVVESLSPAGGASAVPDGAVPFTADSASGSEHPEAQVADLAHWILERNPSLGRERAGWYARLLRRASRRQGLDPWLLAALVAAESGFQERAVSPAGAMGLGQLMPGTAAALGVRDPFDPEENIPGAARYLALQLRRWEGSLELALAAYNAGPGAVERYGGVPPYAETRSYVSAVLSLYREGRKSASGGSRRTLLAAGGSSHARVRGTAATVPREAARPGGFPALTPGEVGLRIGMKRDLGWHRGQAIFAGRMPSAQEASRREIARLRGGDGR